jgi:hypothetical protein
VSATPPISTTGAGSVFLNRGLVDAGGAAGLQVRSDAGREATMTQVDPVQSPEEGVIEYEGQILEQMRFVEDTVNKFAIQNYAASGAVLLAHFAKEAVAVPLLVVTLIVALLNINFAFAIIIQILRLQKLFAFHCITRNHWLDYHHDLSNKLKSDPITRRVLGNNTLPLTVFIIILIAQFIPIVGIILLKYLA